MTSSVPIPDSPLPMDTQLSRTSSEDIPAREQIPFPRTGAEPSLLTPASEATDKLSALPSPSSPPTGRVRSPNLKAAGHSLDASPSSDSHSTAHHPLLSTPEREMQRAAASEGSFGKSSPHQRVFFGKERSSPSPQRNTPNRTTTRLPSSARQSGILPSRPPIAESNFARVVRKSDPVPLAAGLRTVEQSRKSSMDSARSHSATHSRTRSPMRIFSWPGSHPIQSQDEEPFVPVDPFQLRARLASLANSPYSFQERQLELQCDYNCEDSFSCCLPPPVSCTPSSRKRIVSAFKDIRHFLSDTLPRQVYLHLLLRLPSLYFTRIARLFEDAELSRPDVQRMVRSRGVRQRGRADITLPPGVHHHIGPRLPFPEEWTTANVSPALVRFKHSWEFFIDSLLREWKTLNIVSALLLSAILSIFQTNASEDPVIRTAALLSLVCALMSLSFGCIYIVRFGTMRSMYKATRWAEEARKSYTSICWNVWVLLAMPAVWLAWSMILFICTILSFVWRTGSTADPNPPNPLSPLGSLGPRIAVTAVFVLGIIYFFMIIGTLAQYGRDVDPGEDPESGAERVEGNTVNRSRVQERVQERHRERGRERERRSEREIVPDSAPLPAVTGLGLTNLGSPGNGSSDEIAGEKVDIFSTVQANRGNT